MSPDPTDEFGATLKRILFRLGVRHDPPQANGRLEGGTHKRGGKRFLVSLAVFLAVLVPHALSSNRTSWDSRWTIHTALSLVREGDADLDEYPSALAKMEFRSTIQSRGHIYNWYPPGPSLLAAPFVWAMDRLGSLVGQDLAGDARERTPQKAEAFIASFLVALTSVLLYAIARMRLGVKGSLLVVFLFAFCTPAWSSASRAMWTHTPSILMLAAGLWMILRSENGDCPLFLSLASLPLAFSLLCRPTDAIPAGLLGLYVLLKHPRRIPLFLAGAAAVIGPFLYFTWQTYGQFLPDYYHLAPTDERTHFWEALAGHLVSPSRGLLVASPVLALAPVGVWLKIRRRQFGLLDGLLLAAIVLHWLLISLWSRWWGGHSMGPRLWTDMMPFLAWFLVPVAGGLVTPGATLPEKKSDAWRQSKGGAAAVFAATILVLASFLANWSLANRPATMKWNPYPVNVDRRPSRVWDWHDVQILRR